MKKNTKGFTLIELLAVIVILAIIALIATPIVLNLIDKARKGAAESSAYAYINAAEKAAVVTLMDSTGINLSSASCTATDSGKTLKCSGGSLSTEISFSLDIKGDLPKTGSITFNSTGAVANASFDINGYNVSVGADGKATVLSSAAAAPTESSSEASSSEDSGSTSSESVAG